METQQTSGIASLYVGDVCPEVTESDLFEVFNPIGPLASIRLVRDSASLQSLCYAYVNYADVQTAERALDILNHTPIKGKPCRIMWKNPDISLRQSGIGNLYVKNLAETVSNKVLNDAFSIFGNILSCKVAQKGDGNSLGFGFVQFDSEAAATKAIEALHNTELEGKTIFVTHFKCRKDRQAEISASASAKPQPPFTNIYIKDFPIEWTEEILASLFTPFGVTTSVILKTDNLSRPFGFVNFESADAAKAAVDTLNGRFATATGLEAADKTESLIAEKTAQLEQERENAAKAAETETEAEAIRARAIAPVSGRVYVSRAQTKAEREAALKQQFEDKGKAQALAQGVNLYVKFIHTDADDEALRSTFSKFGRVVSGKISRDKETSTSRGFGFIALDTEEAALKAVAALHNQTIAGFSAEGKTLQVSVAEKRTKGESNAPTTAAPAAAASTRKGAALGGKRQGASSSSIRPSNKKTQAAAAPASAAAAAPASSLFDTLSAITDRDEQKRAIGERLYMAICALEETEQAGKLTGMMLDMPLKVLCTLVENQTALKEKVAEGLAVLRQHGEQ